MILYLLKTIICTAFFLGIYFVLLEKAKMPRFNRWYLLLTLVVSFIIPLITFTTEVTVFPVTQKQLTEPLVQEAPVMIEYNTPSAPNLLPVIVAGVYVLVVVILLLRFFVNISKLLSLIHRHPVVRYGNGKLVLLKRQVIPFSFLGHVFLNEEEYGSGEIEEEVLHHEFVHTRQKHSLDILFVELLMALAWFNPLLLLYRKAIQLNHEFLADQSVVAHFNDPFSYQLLLLNRINKANHFYPVSSPFSYKITKKRLVMITHPFNRTSNLLRAFCVIPATALAVFIFSEKVIAQVPAEQTTQAVTQPPTNVYVFGDTTQKPPMLKALPMFYGGTKGGVPEELIREYENLTEKYASVTSKGYRTFATVSDQDKARLKEIFSKMSIDQQAKQEIVFLKPLKPAIKAVPSERLMQLFLDETKYGVWIDRNRVSNASLANYKNTDFSSATVSKLYGKAKEGRSYTHQVNLITNEEFEKNNARIRANKEPHMAISARRARQ